MFVYDTATWTEWFRVAVPNFRGAPRFSPDGKVLAVAAGGVGLWDVAARRPVQQTADLPRLWQYSALTFSHDGRTLTGFDHDSPAAVTWELATGREVERHLGDEAIRRAPSGLARVSPDGRFRLTLAAEPADEATVTDLSDGRQVGRFRLPDRGSWSVRLGGGGRHFYSCDGTRVRLWDAASGSPLGVLADFSAAGDFVTSDQGDTAPANPDAAPSPCGRYVAVFPRNWGGKDVPVQVFDPATRRKVCEVRAGGRPWLVWSADGGRFVTVTPSAPGDDRTSSVLTVWAVPDGRPVLRAEVAADTRAVWFIPDLRSFVGSPRHARGRSVRLHETATGRERHRFEAAGECGEACAFSPDGRYLAATQGSPPVAVWDIRTGPRRATPGTAIASAWEGLAAGPGEAFHAARLVAAFPDRSVPFLRGQHAPDGLRAVRAVEAVEWAGTPDAVRLLETWASGPVGSVLADEAGSALARIARR